MKPSFALDFRDGLVTLLHRTSRGWSQVGSTAFDAPDFTEALGYMRSTALGLSPRGITTKLIIPNEQILYTQIHAPGPEPVKRRRQIRAGLEGLTPYALDDLVYDWWGTGPELQVAVLAKETLAEAEAFATEHRFNPVSFVAVPDNGTYLGEPFFGASALSATLLADGEKVERDTEAVIVVARDFLRPETAVQPEAEDTAAPAVQPETVAEVEPVAIETAEAEPTPEPATEPEPVLAQDPEPVAKPDPAPEQGEPEVSVTPDDLAPDLSERAQSQPVLPEPVVPRADPAPESMPARPAALVPEAPMVVDAVGDGDSAVEDDTPAAPAAEIVAAFASRRTAAIAAATAGTTKPAAVMEARIPSVGPAPAQRPTVPRPSLAKPVPVVAASSAKSAAPAPRPSGAKAVKPAAASVTAPGIQGAKRERTVVPMISASEGKDPKAAPKPLTGLGSRAPAVKGKPRFLGLILTLILLALLAGVAVWSSWNLGTNDTTGTGAGTPAAANQASAAQPGATPEAVTTAQVAPATAPVATAPAPAPQAAVTPAPAAVDSAPAPDTTATAVVASAPETSVETPAPAAADVPTAQDEALADGQTIEPADVGLAPQTTATATAMAAPAAAPAPVVEHAPNTQVSTMAAVATPPGNEAQDEIFLASTDTPPKTSDPIALPAIVAGADPNPAAAPPPPPFGTVYKFDADGRIIPTPEGIVTPEGVLLIAGKPSQVPPARPADLAGPVVAPDAADVSLDTATGAASVPDPSLSGKRPQDRPAGLVPPVDQQGTATNLAPDARFASLRPQARPASVTAAANPNGDAGQASLAADGFALVTSPKPPARPAQLNDAVNDAVAAALNEAAPDTEVASNTTAPEAQVEPETETAAPSLPTNASVAKQATIKNALVTNRVALLAVFGTPSTRFAMIRQANGSVKKVKVGDTVEGGQIAGITANSVQYQKGGQIVTLSLPTG